MKRDNAEVHNLMEKVERYSKELLRMTMRDYSQYYWANNWIDGLEYDLWSYTCGDSNTMWKTGFGPGLKKSDRERLMDLAIEAGGWYTWEKNYPTEVFVSMKKWNRMYSEYKNRG